MAKETTKLVTPLVQQTGSYGIARPHEPMQIEAGLADKLVKRGRWVLGKSDVALAREKAVADRKRQADAPDPARVLRLRELMSDVPADAMTGDGEPDVNALNARLEEGEERITAGERSAVWAAMKADGAAVGAAAATAGAAGEPAGGAGEDAGAAKAGAPKPRS